LLLLAALAAPAAAPAWAPAPFKPPLGDERGWTGWRGPNRTGVSLEKGLLTRWPKEGPKQLWKATGLGEGYSSPAVAGGRVYVLGTRNGKEHVFCLDAKWNGKELWTAELGPGLKNRGPSHDGPRSTPSVDGDRVYALGSDGDLLCVSAAGKAVWRKHLVRDLAGVRGSWGYAESPLIDGEQLVCTPGGAKATMAALNKKTGAVVWKASAAKGNQAAYASAVAAEVGGVRHYVQFLAGCVVGVRARDGRILWTYEGVSGNANCVTPIFHDGHVFVTAYGKGPVGKPGGALLKLKAEKGSVGATEVYHTTALANYYGGVVCVGGCLYGTNASALVCLDYKTGRLRWQNPSVGKGAVVSADGRLYVRGDRGPVALVTASPAGYTEKGRFSPPDSGKSTARPHPVIADGRLYLREQGELVCFDLRKP
jgi:outer membrane protein assembly factor BamB